jgi:hypothetical protein
MKPILQVAAIALAFAAGAAASGRLAEWRAGPDEPIPAAVTATRTDPAAPEAGRCLDEIEMRRVIREELTMAAAAAPAAHGPPTAGSVASTAAPIASPEQVEFVNRRVDEYIRAGVISESEMTRLESEIATLDPAARRAALQKIVRAMNTGALEGRL